jgi:hypothetical protein
MNALKTKRGSLAILALLLFSIFLTGCLPTSNNSQKAENQKYFEGHEGIKMEFIEGSPERKLYYYSDQPYNTFDVAAEVTNVGSSWAWGGIYLSGYDPTMINFAGIGDSDASTACFINAMGFGQGSFDGLFSCNNFALRGGSYKGDEYASINLGSIFGSGGRYNNAFDLSRLFGQENFRYTNAGEQWQIKFNNPNIDLDYANRGPLFFSLYQGLDFTRTFGIDYLIQGDTYEYPGGEKSFVTFEGDIVNWPAGLDETTQHFMITNCYLYTTYAAPVVCMDPSPYSEGKKVCTPSPVTFTKGQGAPVAITRIEQENTPRQSIFTIHVKNVAQGTVYDPGKIEMCSPYFPGRVTSEDINLVIVGDVRVSGDPNPLRCNPTDRTLRLNSRTGEGVITCVYDMPLTGLKSAYQTPLVVELRYGYSDTIQKDVLIKRAI